ncbi:MAG: TonB-dependent receptor [Verrucomicrobiales bacterium]|nr:TonB-dependent receptor [Verrucomicrobiales bacterium]
MSYDLSRTPRLGSRAAFSWVLMGTLPALGAAEEPVRMAAAAPLEVLPAMIVRGEAESDALVQDPFLTEVEGTRIFSGKHATVLDLDAYPKVQANNYRQALALTPGLLYSEESTPLVSLGYRGIGEPHRSQFLQVLKDGIPIHADPFGYPESYYTPPLDVVDRIEFVRGGAALLYGPQPGGALNYVTYQPRTDRAISGRSQHVFGSDGLYSTYNAFDGTSGSLGYLGYYNHRQSEGFRASNSDYVLDGGHFKLVWDTAENSRWTLALDAYEEAHGEPGGLTFATGANTVNYDVDRAAVSRPNDRFQLRRYVPSLRYDLTVSEGIEFSLQVWGGYYERWSRRQRGGGFGTLPSGPTASSNDIERQEFFTLGIEPRLSLAWGGAEDSHVLAAGVQYYQSDSPRVDRRGATATAENGVVFREADRAVHYGAVFLENRFVWGRFSLTPGVRLESIHQDLDSRNLDLATGAVLSRGEKDQLDFEPLFGLGLGYQLGEGKELYANVSESYRTTVFTESLIVPSSGTVAPADLAPSKGIQYEMGFRGHPKPWVTWDTSLFLVDLDNKFGGTVTAGNITTLRNVGRTLNYGWDAAAYLDLMGVLDARDGLDRVGRFGSFNVYGNLTLLSAEIDGGVSDGRRPQYAPEFMARSGLIYRWQERVKVAFLGTFMGAHFATDDENPTRAIPAYMTWDLTAEAAVYKDVVRLMAGINNLFDEDYYARIRGDGIDPAYGRNFYAGFSVAF